MTGYKYSTSVTQRIAKGVTATFTANGDSINEVIVETGELMNQWRVLLESRKKRAQFTTDEVEELK
jgi:hypothetical protein